MRGYKELSWFGLSSERHVCNRLDSIGLSLARISPAQLFFDGVDHKGWIRLMWARLSCAGIGSAVFPCNRLTGPD